MTTQTTLVDAPPAARAGTDLRRATRILAAVVLPIGPAAVAVLRYVLPYNTTDSARTIAHKAAAHPTTQSLVVWLGFVGILTLVPAVLWVGRLTRRAAPRLTAAALLLLVPGYVALGMLVASDAALYFAVHRHLDPKLAGDMYAQLHPVVVVAGGGFVLGHVVGTVLLGIALWRTHAVPQWAALAVIIAQPMHFVAAIIVASHTLDLAGWGCNALGFAAASVAILRTRDDDWDLAPR